MINTILFATDLGVFTAHGLVHVEALAEKFNASIAIVHAVPPIGDLAAAVVRSHCSELVKAEVLKTPHIKGLLESVREDIFESLLKDPSHSGELLARIHSINVLPGQPAAVILEEADRLGADLIVMGSHGIGALDSRVLGSVVTKVMQLTRVPVYLVPMMDPAKLYGAQLGVSGFRA